MSKHGSHRLTLLYSRDQIDQRVRELAAAIDADYAGADLVLVGILRGAFVFLADLIRHLRIPVEIDFIGAASYGNRTETSGRLTITKKLQVPIKGRDVLLVEDIEDTGLTLQSVVDALKGEAPRSIRVCALIDKRVRRTIDLRVDYLGFNIAAGFIVGYGIDYAEHYRQLPAIYRIEGLDERGGGR
jgi:hypoxanthine phosphoribosyltransferase